MLSDEGGGIGHDWTSWTNGSNRNDNLSESAVTEEDLASWR
jgi:hypothetical protein